MSLSDKRKTSNSYRDDEKDLIVIDDLENGVYLEKDIKYFITRIRNRLVTNEPIESGDINRIIDEEAGDNLI